MEAINYISNWYNWLLGILITGVMFMVAYNGLRMVLSTSDEANITYREKIKKLIIIAVISTSLLGIINLVKSFMGYQ